MPTAHLDLDAYLARVGATREPPSLEALTQLQIAHAHTFTFDNIDVLLRQHPGVELTAVQEKFVGRGRGGYCFEHATLVHAVLEALGYDAVLHLSRVGDPDLAPRTHLVVVATVDDERYLIDPGIGIPPLGPVPLRQGGRLDGPIWPHEIRRYDEGAAGAGWQLWRHRSSGWERMHTVDPLPVRRIDVEMGHWFTSTNPGSHFTTSLTLCKHGVASDGTPIQTSVTFDGVTERRDGEPSVTRPFDADELPELVTRLGAGLTDEETGQLVGIVKKLRS